MILADHQIIKAQAAGEIEVDPWVPQNVQPCSLDVRLDRGVRFFKSSLIGVDLKEAKPLTYLKESNSFVLRPGEFVLGSTVERFVFSASIVGQLNGKSSLGRLGLQVHATAGFIDPGFIGPITLELSNISPLPLRLYADMKVGQMVFMRLGEPCEHPYGSDGLGSKYQNQDGPTESMYYRNFESP